MKLFALGANPEVRFSHDGPTIYYISQNIRTRWTAQTL